MGRYLLKLQDGRKSHYLLWSDVVDAPVEHFDTKGLVETWLSQQRHLSPSEIKEIMDRIYTQGNSSRDGRTNGDIMRLNRAGRNESYLTEGQIIEFYCRQEGEGEPPLGTFEPS